MMGNQDKINREIYDEMVALIARMQEGKPPSNTDEGQRYAEAIRQMELTIAYFQTFIL